MIKIQMTQEQYEAFKAKIIDRCDQFINQPVIDFGYDEPDVRTLDVACLDAGKAWLIKMLTDAFQKQLKWNEPLIFPMENGGWRFEWDSIHANKEKHINQALYIDFDPELHYGSLEVIDGDFFERDDDTLERLETALLSYLKRMESY